MLLLSWTYSVLCAIVMPMLHKASVLNLSYTTYSYDPITGRLINITIRLMDFYLSNNWIIKVTFVYQTFNQALTCVMVFCSPLIGWGHPKSSKLWNYEWSYRFVWKLDPHCTFPTHFAKQKRFTPKMPFVDMLILFKLSFFRLTFFY